MKFTESFEKKNKNFKNNFLENRVFRSCRNATFEYHQYLILHTIDIIKCIDLSGETKNHKNERKLLLKNTEWNRNSSTRALLWCLNVLNRAMFLVYKRYAFIVRRIV